VFNFLLDLAHLLVSFLRTLERDIRADRDLGSKAAKEKDETHGAFLEIPNSDSGQSSSSHPHEVLLTIRESGAGRRSAGKGSVGGTRIDRATEATLRRRNEGSRAEDLQRDKTTACQSRDWQRRACSEAREVRMKREEGRCRVMQPGIDLTSAEIRCEIIS
jgi:hypothetical protein